MKNSIGNSVALDMARILKSESHQRLFNKVATVVEKPVKDALSVIASEEKSEKCECTEDKKCAYCDDMKAKAFNEIVNQLTKISVVLEGFGHIKSATAMVNALETFVNEITASEDENDVSARDILKEDYSEGKIHPNLSDELAEVDPEEEKNLLENPKLMKEYLNNPAAQEAARADVAREWEGLDDSDIEGALDATQVNGRGVLHDSAPPELEDQNVYNLLDKELSEQWGYNPEYGMEDDFRIDNDRGTLPPPHKLASEDDLLDELENDEEEAKILADYEEYIKGHQAWLRHMMLAEEQNPPSTYESFKHRRKSDKKLTKDATAKLERLIRLAEDGDDLDPYGFTYNSDLDGDNLEETVRMPGGDRVSYKDLSPEERLDLEMGAGLHEDLGIDPDSLTDEDFGYFDDEDEDYIPAWDR